MYLPFTYIVKDSDTFSENIALSTYQPLLGLGGAFIRKDPKGIEGVGLMSRIRDFLDVLP
jgi:hypothetical protein